jgi:hypothetical protein
MPTGVMDLAWTTLYIMLVLISNEIRLRDLFLPHREELDASGRIPI